MTSIFRFTESRQGQGRRSFIAPINIFELQDETDPSLQIDPQPLPKIPRQLFYKIDFVTLHSVQVFNDRRELRIFNLSAEAVSKTGDGDPWSQRLKHFLQLVCQHTLRIGND